MKKMIALTILAGVGGVVYWQKHRDFFKRLHLVLQRQGIEVIQVTEMAAHLLGASEGKKYITDAGTFEIYRFAKDSPIWHTITKTNQFSLEPATCFPVILNGCYMLYASHAAPLITDLFLSL